MARYRRRRRGRKSYRRRGKMRRRRGALRIGYRM